MSNEINEDDIPDHAFGDSDESQRPVCPRTTEEVSISPKAYAFKGFPDLTCWKTMAKREVTPEEYSDALYNFEEGKDPAILKGFVSRTGKNFNAGLKLKDNEDGWEFFFPPAETSSHVCPVSNEPIEIREKLYVFPGIPSGGFWKNRAGRNMSIPDYLSVIEAKGEPVMFQGFVSKKKKEEYDSELVFRDDKISFAWELKEK